MLFQIESCKKPITTNEPVYNLLRGSSPLFYGKEGKFFLGEFWDFILKKTRLRL